MALWLGQLVISKATRKGPAFRLQYWRNPSMSPAFVGFDSVEDLRRYLRHCRLSNITPDEVIEQLQTVPQVLLSTIECEEKIG
jgi:hypothetical protein